MRGSKIARQIIRQQQYDAKRKKIVMELRQRLLEKRGESNGKRAESSAYGLETASREARDIEERAKG